MPGVYLIYHGDPGRAGQLSPSDAEASLTPKGGERPAGYEMVRESALALTAEESRDVER